MVIRQLQDSVNAFGAQQHRTASYGCTAEGVVFSSQSDLDQWLSDEELSTEALDTDATITLLSNIE